MKIKYLVSLLLLSRLTFGSQDHVQPQGQKDAIIEQPDDLRVLTSLQEGLQDNNLRIVLPSGLRSSLSYVVLPCEYSRKRTREEESDHQGAQ